MPEFQTRGMSMHYKVFGKPQNAPVLMLAGLGGTGKSWGTLPERFAEDHFVILPDHRATGQSSGSASVYTTAQLAADFASLVQHLDLGPAHVVGSSTGAPSPNSWPSITPATFAQSPWLPRLPASMRSRKDNSSSAES